MSHQIKQTAEKLLGRPLTKKDGMSFSKIKTIENSLGLKLPTTLKDFYLLVGNMDAFMNSFEHFVEPYIYGEMLIFTVENQAVCYWGINIRDTENDMVFQCTDIECDNPEWYSEDVSLADFLVISMYYQCAQGGYEHGKVVWVDDFENNDKCMQYIANITIGYEKVVEHNGLVVYQNKGKLIWYFMGVAAKLGK